MKYLVTLFVILLMVVVAVKCENDYKSEYCKERTIKLAMSKGCGKIVCNKDSTNFAMTGCPLGHCARGMKEEFTKGDRSKPFPDCCPQLKCT